MIVCAKCGSEMALNPHPRAGKADYMLEVGTMYVCIPCLVKSRHQWVERASRAEGQIENTRQSTLREVADWLEQECTEHPQFGVNIMGYPDMDEEITFHSHRYLCPKCRDSLRNGVIPKGEENYD